MALVLMWVGCTVLLRPHSVVVSVGGGLLLTGLTGMAGLLVFRLVQALVR